MRPPYTQPRTLKLGNTNFILPDAIEWLTPAGAPPNSIENALLAGDHDTPGPYLTLIKWHPGYMSAPHTYITDRFAFVISGIWWIGDGPDYDPAGCTPVPAGSFIHRPAGTPHYDGVISGAAEPAVIALSGIAPIHLEFVHPAEPPLRAA
ncbi:MAG: cupin domain-containing protein [Parvibaculaceae bacterium]|nr:cupin domain-containing protein [Parvibaculaceae bacterium]